MASGYENGVSTRKLILDTCTKLFLENGFHETSYEDICREAHVNRGSIYYHFKEKENIRYDVLWEITVRFKKFVARYCPEKRFHYLLAVYMIWHQLLTDTRFMKFNIDYFLDYPVYCKRHGISKYYDVLYEGMYKNIWDTKKVEPLAYASVYGHIMGVMQLAASRPGIFTALELFQHCIIYCNTIFGISKEEIEQLWDELLPYIEKLPLDSYDAITM